ncbi:hypothetical protein HDU84_003959 [Entophlyctis sp. JEL0112]|nr:hypothetical protein HDU84_003959 [Entophlyctis sp. JEL0112]
MDPDSSSIVRITGNMSLSVNATISNVNIPLNIPVSVAPMIWRVAVQTDVMTNESGIMTQETIYLPLATVSFLSPISIQDSVVSINEESINVQLLNSSDLGSSEVELPNASAFPLGAFYFRSFLNCLMSGSSADLPKLVIETNADINIGGWLSLKSIYLKRVLDIGQTLVDGGYTFASGTSASNNSASPLQVFLSNLTSNSGGSEYSASLTIKTPPKNALTLPPAGLEISARVNISSVPIARLELPKLQATQGTPNITTNVEATKLQSDWTIIGSLLQSSLKLGVDQVAAAYADGSSLPAWVLDLANAAWLSVPFDSLGSGVTGSVNSLVD